MFRTFTPTNKHSATSSWQLGSCSDQQRQVMCGSLLTSEFQNSSTCSPSYFLQFCSSEPLCSQNGANQEPSGNSSNLTRGGEALIHSPNPKCNHKAPKQRFSTWTPNHSQSSTARSTTTKTPKNSSNTALTQPTPQQPSPTLP